MTDETLPAKIPNSELATSKRGRNIRLGKGLSKRRLQLIEEMVFNGLTRQNAAEKIGLSDRGARYALSEPVVMAEYRKSLQVLRESEKPRSIHKLAELRDQNRSLKVSLEASRTLAADAPNGPTINVGLNVNVQPGYICDISQHAVRARQILQENGLKSHDA